jgi:CMP-N-acetylneuraminic acid synthetase
MKNINFRNNYLAIILARKGSKRLKNKNILKFGRQPLISRTIKNLKKIKHLFKDIVVSSDSKKIEKISKKEKVLFIKRPKYLSNSSATSEKSTLHLIKIYQKKYAKINYVILCQPTSPLRRNVTIKKVINLSKNFPKKQIVGVDLKKKPNGVIYLSPVKMLEKGASFSARGFIPFVIKSKKESIDIDTKEDFLNAKKYLK